MTMRRREPSAMTEAERSVSWSVAATDTRVGRLCASALVGWLSAPIVGVLAVLAFGLAGRVASGDYEVVAVVLLLFAVGGPVSLIGLLAALAADEITLPDWLSFVDGDGLSPAGVVASAALGFVALAAGLAAAGALAWAGYLAILVLAVTGLALASPEGAVDRDAGTLTVNDRTHALADLTAVDAYPLGNVVLVRPRFAPRPGGRDAPWLVPMPADVYERVEPAFAEGVAAEPDVPDTASTSDRVVLGLGGAFSLALAAGLALVAATSANEGVAMLYWGASAPALVGVLLVVLAVRNE